MSAVGNDNGPVDEVEGAGGGEASNRGSGGSLFKRVTSGEPQDRGVRRWVFASGGALVALVAAGFGVRQWRRRG